MQEMQASGWIDFQSHTVSHVDLAIQTAGNLAMQLTSSKRSLDTDLKQNTSVIVYPSGKSSAQVEQAAATAGYKVGLIEGGTIALGGGDLFNVPRLRMSTGISAATLLDQMAAAVSYNTANTSP
jgi:rhodanese-related sulfurtransferase